MHVSWEDCYRNTTELEEAEVALSNDNVVLTTINILFFKVKRYKIFPISWCWCQCVTLYPCCCPNRNHLTRSSGTYTCGGARHADMKMNLTYVCSTNQGFKTLHGGILNDVQGDMTQNSYCVPWKNYIETVKWLLMQVSQSFTCLRGEIIFFLIHMWCKQIYVTHCTISWF